jgi:RecB family endonuclease NucS
MEINKLKAMVSNPLWGEVEGFLQEQIQTTQLELEVATSELEVYRKQGSLASLRKLLMLKERIKK